MKLSSKIPALLAALLLAACGESAPESGGHAGEGHEHGAAAGGASFEEGKGIRLLPETEQALGVRTAEVVTSPLEPLVQLTAQIYQTAEESEDARAAAAVDSATAAHLEPGAKVSFAVNGRAREGVVRAIDPTQAAALGNVEILLDLPDPDRELAIGAFVPVAVRLPAAEATNIPRSAVLETATGKFAYVKNGRFLLRTPVTTGLETPDTIEITDGLYDGDVVVSNPVESLYLIELRATKGGGHCH